MKVPIYRTVYDQDKEVTLKRERTMYVKEVDRVLNGATAAEIINSVFHAYERTEEYTYLLCLNAAGKVRGLFELSHGTVDRALVSTRDIFQKCLLAGAKSFIIAHNHPSGDTCPSDMDISISRKIKEAAKLMDLVYNDFLIIGDQWGVIYSFAECEIL